MKAYGDDALVKAVLDDHTCADLTPRLRTTLDFLQKLTLQPWELDTSDVEPMRRAGLSDEAIIEAMGVCMVFSIIDRIADAFDFPVSNAEQLRWIERMLINIGYNAASLPG